MNILIISEYIAPVQAIASVRWTKLSKYLSRNHECTVTVLTNQKSYKNRIFGLRFYVRDWAAAVDLESFRTRFISITAEQIVSNIAYNIGRSALDLLRKCSAMSGSANVKASTESFSQDVRIKNKVSRRILAFLAGEFPAKIGEALGRFWGEAIYKAGVKEALNWDSYDVVVSTYGPLWTHQIARQIKLKHPDITWIADFRDPFVISERTNTEKMRALAGEITHGADCVTAVSRGTIDNLFLPQDMNAYVLTNGYDVEESPIRTPCQSSLFRIVYTGTLVSEGGNKRDLSPLFIQLEELIASGEVDATKIRVEYAGSTAHLFAPFSRRFPSIPVLDHGLLSRKEALTLQESASLLVVASWNTSIQTGVLTGKIFEYMSKDIPIIGLCSGDVPSSDIRRLIEDSYLGVCYEEADEATYHILRDYLREKYHEWENMGRTTRDARSRQLVKKYSYPALADRFISIVNSLKSA